MAKFINKNTGNTLIVKDKATIKMMRESDRYKEVGVTKAPTKKTPAKKADIAEE